MDKLQVRSRRFLNEKFSYTLPKARKCKSIPQRPFSSICAVFVLTGLIIRAVNVFIVIVIVVIAIVVRTIVVVVITDVVVLIPVTLPKP